MNGLWVISHIVLWLIVIVLVLVILTLSREIENLHSRLDSLQKYIINNKYVPSKRKQIDIIGEDQLSIPVDISEKAKDVN